VIPLLDPVNGVYSRQRPHQPSWLCKPEVAGSIPARSTPTSRADLAGTARKSAIPALRRIDAAAYRSTPLQTLLPGSRQALQGLDTVWVTSADASSSEA